MKNIILAICLLISTGMFAQSGYEKAMQRGLNMLKSAENVPQFNAASSFFETIGKNEKNQWLPYYYAAFARIESAFRDEQADKDKVAAEANALIAKADSLQPDNSEIYCLKYMAATLALLVDPAARWQSYGMAATAALDKAKSLDHSNPRPYFLEAKAALNTPEQYGGGKKKAKKLFLKALKLYSEFQPTSPLYPDWGKPQAEKGLDQCSE
ncbi:MAG: hypothetical protein J5I59_10720 [Saprospiraceae bacterium]|nr:hypothetical protein [Saprospiraceae bacterium]